MIAERTMHWLRVYPLFCALLMIFASSGRLEAHTGKVRIWNLLDGPVDILLGESRCLYLDDDKSFPKRVERMGLYSFVLSSSYFCSGYGSLEFLFRARNHEKAATLGKVTTLLRSSYSGVGGWSRTKKMRIDESIEFHLFPPPNKELSEWGQVDFTIVLFKKDSKQLK